MASTESEKQVILIGIDDSDFSTNALLWTLDHLLSPTLNHNFKLVLVYARPSVSASVGFVGPGASEVLPIVEADLRRIAAKVTENAKDLCHKKSVNDVSVDVMEGDPRIVLCDAVEKHHASMLVVGSHGYGALKRAVLGSVSDYCAHHAHCSVMIVKKPKHKH